MPDELKFLLIDLELTFAVYYAYPSKREQYLSASNIIHDQFCTCAAWNWLDETTTHVVKLTDNKRRFKKNFRDDFEIALKLHTLMEEADVIIAHNGDNFDIKHANTLFLKHGLGPIPQQKSIDTLKVARKYFAFPGNSLDQLSKRFGSKGKNQKPDWYKMTEGSAEEIDRAAIYCKNDVRELKKVFKKVRPYIQNFPATAKNNSKPERCHKCGSNHIVSNGSTVRTYGKFKRYKCMDCGSWIAGEKIT